MRCGSSVRQSCRWCFLDLLANDGGTASVRTARRRNHEIADWGNGAHGGELQELLARP